MRTLYKNPDGKTIPRDSGGVLFCGCCPEPYCCPDYYNLDAVISDLSLCGGEFDCFELPYGAATGGNMTILTGSLNGLISAIPSIGAKHWRSAVVISGITTTVNLKAYNGLGCTEAYLLETSYDATVYIDITCLDGNYTVTVYADILFSTHTEFNGRYVFFKTETPDPAIVSNQFPNLFGCYIKVGAELVAGYGGTITITCDTA